jgi:hypothetical protein
MLVPAAVAGSEERIRAGEVAMLAMVAGLPDAGYPA